MALGVHHHVDHIAAGHGLLVIHASTALVADAVGDHRGAAGGGQCVVVRPHHRSGGHRHRADDGARCDGMVVIPSAVAAIAAVHIDVDIASIDIDVSGIDPIPRVGRVAGIDIVAVAAGANVVPVRV